MKNHCYWVYILFKERAQKTYIGMTNNLRRRVFEHKIGLLDGYSKEHDLTKLAYYEQYKYVDKAIAREKQLKAWKRAWKYRLIETENPEWLDLAADIDGYIAKLDPQQIDAYIEQHKNCPRK